MCSPHCRHHGRRGSVHPPDLKTWGSSEQRPRFRPGCQVFLLPWHSQALLIQKLPLIQWLSLCTNGACWERSCGLAHRAPWGGFSTSHLCCFGQLCNSQLPSGTLTHLLTPSSISCWRFNARSF